MFAGLLAWKGNDWGAGIMLSAPIVAMVRTFINSTREAADDEDTKPSTTSKTPKPFNSNDILEGFDDERDRLPLVMLQKAQHAAEAAAASARLLETEVGNRLAAIEGRLNGVDQRLVSAENRLSALYAGQNAHNLALMRIADTQSEHSARFDAIDNRFDRIDQTLASILAKLP